MKCVRGVQILADYFLRFEFVPEFVHNQRWPGDDTKVWSIV